MRSRLGRDRERRGRAWGSAAFSTLRRSTLLLCGGWGRERKDGPSGALARA